MTAFNCPQPGCFPARYTILSQQLYTLLENCQCLKHKPGAIRAILAPSSSLGLVALQPLLAFCLRFEEEEGDNCWVFCRWRQLLGVLSAG